MIERPTQSSSGGSPPRAADTEAALEELRRLLLGREQGELSRLARRVEDVSQRVDDVSVVLPQAVHRSVQRDDGLAHALTPAVERALRESIRRDPGVVTTAVFPVIGPAVRRSIGEALRRLVQTLDQTLENSVSWRGLRWRWEAWRSGRPFAEVVLRHTLIFRVEQVFLIHRPSGLLLLHVAAPGVEASDQDLISGMLTAIRDFVADSFRSGPGDELNAIEVGDLQLWIEAGPRALLAAAIRGQAPVDFRARLQGAMEAVHGQTSAALEGFSGDATAFETVRPALESCLESQFRCGARKRHPWRFLGVFGLILVVGVGWLLGRWERASMRAELVSRLREEPGLVVTGSGVRGGEFWVEGLRDPGAMDPAVVARELGFEEGTTVRFRWAPYQDLSSELVLKRARARLGVPAGVEIRMREGVLEVSGVARPEWWRGVRGVAEGLAGVSGVDASGLREDAEEAGEVEALVAELEGRRVVFDTGRIEGRAAAGEISTVIELAKRLSAVADSGGRTPYIVVMGHADPSGTEEGNLKLSQQRAEWIKHRLVNAGIPSERVEARGMGARELIRPEAPEAPENRRVTFKVRWER